MNDPLHAHSYWRTLAGALVCACTPTTEPITELKEQD